MGLFTVGLRDDDFEPAYNDVPDRRDGGRIQLAQARVRGMASMGRMEGAKRVRRRRGMGCVGRQREKPARHGGRRLNDAAPFVSDGIIDVDSFTSFYTSVRNRRMSRAGKVLEIHIAHILDARGIEYEAQARTENGKKPDFLFPSQAAYEDPTFPETQLRMLASKTSIKDRFRQVADEANRIRDKHLFTLTPGDVTHPKLAQLDELHIHLVMPKVVKESYDDLIQGETMTFSRFIEEIQGLPADRPQSLTLL